MKLRTSITLNLVLLAIVAAFIIRDGLQATGRAVNGHYFPEKKPEVFAAPLPPPAPPEKFDYRL